MLFPKITSYLVTKCKPFFKFVLGRFVFARFAWPTPTEAAAVFFLGKRTLAGTSPAKLTALQKEHTHTHKPKKGH